MREITFRIYDKSQSKMLYSFFENEENDKREWYPFSFCIGFSNWSLRDLSELMQFTGLTDKNGKKIFEGDIVKNKNNEIGVAGYYEFYSETLTPEYHTTTVSLKNGKRLYWITKDCEIIGNIYENPKLLEENN